MSRQRIDGRKASAPQLTRTVTSTPKAEARKVATGVTGIRAQSGQLFDGKVGRSGRHVDDTSARRPAQLQLHGAPFVTPAAPVLKAPAAQRDVATGHATPVSALTKAFDALTPPAVTGDVRLLEHNTESWLSMWHTLSNATGSIDASYFIFQRDIFGMAYLGQLLHKADQGQRVRLMLDAAGDSFGRKGFTLSFRGQDYLQELVNTGSAQVKVYHPVHKKVLSSLKGGERPFSGVANNHDKLLRTSDTVITGGRNISKDYFTAPEDRADVYRDSDVMVKGRAAAKAFTKAFETEWNADSLHFKVFEDTAGNLARRDLELHAASLMMDHWLHAPPMAEAEKARLRTDKGYRKAQAEVLLDSALARLPERGVQREAGFWDRRNLRALAEELAGYAELRGAAENFNPLEGMHPNQTLKVLDRSSAAVKSEDELSTALASLAAGAKQRILIQNPYVVLTEGAVQALEAAGKRGVQIELLTNSPDSTDSLMTQAFFLADWPRILARVPNMRIFVLTGDQKLHAKAATADDEVSVVGSYNLDLISEQINGEIALASRSPEVAKDVRRSFEADKANPKFGVVEYTIARDDAGQPILRDGDPVITFGANDHMSTWNKVKYGVLGGLIALARKLPALKAISGIELNGTR